MKNIHKLYVEPVLPIETLRDVKRLLGRVNIMDICAKEYLSEGGCPQYNRGCGQTKCNSGKLHLENEVLRKQVYEKSREFNEWEQFINTPSESNKKNTGPGYSNRVLRQGNQKTKRNYKAALEKPRTTNSIMFEEEEKLIRVTKFKAITSDQLKTEISEIINYPRIVNLITKVEISNEKIQFKGERFGAIKFKEEIQTNQFLNCWEAFYTDKNQQIKFEQWYDVRDSVKTGPSPIRKPKNKLDSREIVEIFTRIHALEVKGEQRDKRTTERFKKQESRFDRLEQNLQRSLQDQFKSFSTEMRGILKIRDQETNERR